MADDIGDTRDAGALLFEVEPGLACLFGHDAPGDLDLIAPTLLPESATTQIRTAAAAAVGIANVGAQASHALGAFQGLVKLTPETMELLKTLRPMVDASTGANLGTLVDSSGSAAAQIRWFPAGAVAAGPALAAIGPALALLAIQQQLAECSALIEENLALTDEVLAAIRTERWAEATGLRDAMVKAVGEARHVGEVTDAVWQNVAAHEAPLAKARIEFRAKAQRHLAGLCDTDSHGEHRTYLVHHGEAVLRDVQALLVAQSAWFMYQAIRAGHLHHRAEADPSAGRLLEKVIDDAREQRARDLRTAGDLLDALHHQLWIMAELRGRSTLPFGKNKKASADVSRHCRALLTHLGEVRLQFGLTEPPLPVPVLSAFPGEVPEVLPEALRWHLDDGEQVLAVAGARSRDGVLGDDMYVVMTDRRLLIADEDDVADRGEFDQIVPLSEIRYARVSEPNEEKVGKRARRRLDIVTPDRDVRLVFERASAHAQRDAVDRVIQLIRSRMSLPAEEVPPSPLVGEERAISDGGR